MSGDFSRESMMDMFIFETVQLLEQLEQEILNSEKENGFSTPAINQIFRIMHTIKGSAAMMLFKNISSLAHATEDLFYFIRENKPAKINQSGLTDIVLECSDYIKGEMDEIQNGKTEDREAAELLQKVKAFLEQLRNGLDEEPASELPAAELTQKDPCEAGGKAAFELTYRETAEAGKTYYKATVLFEEGCEMENIRAFTLVHNLKEVAENIQYWPEDIMTNEASAEVIRQEGFIVLFASDQLLDNLQILFMQNAFIGRLQIDEWQLAQPEAEPAQSAKARIILDEEEARTAVAVPGSPSKPAQSAPASQQSLISVNVTKLDMLMDLVGELVITEAMVTQNAEVAALSLDSFHKSARQLKKLMAELQDVVMSIRMVPLAPTFQKMNRIVRDACKTLHKEVGLKIVGEETEIDKNMIEQISDPIMHLIRNSLDHGIETPEGRRTAGKPGRGTITLEAKNSGGEVWITVKDDGRGLDREKIMKKARENGLTGKADHELTDKEVYSFIFLPGFSTKDAVTELSGRGVGMDVVTKNIEKLGGIIQIDSKLGEGTTIMIKIPLTLAIIEGMTIRVGDSRYTIPITSIRQSFRAQPSDVIIDPDGNEMMIIRGVCYPVIRLHEVFRVHTDVTQISQGITILVEHNDKGACVFADQLLGQQQVVIKALPVYIKKVRGLAGCTLLGDGNISLILDMDDVISSQCRGQYGRQA